MFHSAEKNHFWLEFVTHWHPLEVNFRADWTLAKNSHFEPIPIEENRKQNVRVVCVFGKSSRSVVATHSGHPFYTSPGTKEPATDPNGWTIIFEFVHAVYLNLFLLILPASRIFLMRGCYHLYDIPNCTKLILCIRNRIRKWK